MEFLSLKSNFSPPKTVRLDIYSLIFVQIPNKHEQIQRISQRPHNQVKIANNSTVANANKPPAQQENEIQNKLNQRKTCVMCYKNALR